MAIYSQPSLRQPESISPEFYFSSQAFITKAQADINQLLNTWQDSVRSLPPHKKVLGPFLKFKSIYTRLGWIYIHLSVVDPALRKHWFSTLSRLLINQLNQPNQPLKQIGPSSPYGHYGVLSPNHRYSDRNSTSSLILKLTDISTHSLPNYPNNWIDTSKIQLTNHLNNPLKTLPSTVNFIIIIIIILTIITKTHHHHHQPHSPSNIEHILTPTYSDLLHQQSSPQIRSIKVSLQNSSSSDPQIYITPNPQPPPITSHHNLDRITETVLKTKDEFQKWKIEQDQSLCDPTELNRLRTSYLSTKSFLNQPTASTSTSSGLGLMVGNNNSDGGAEDPLTKELFIEAIGMTRKVIQKTGPGLDHLLFPEPHSSSKSNTTISSTGVNLKSKNSKKNKKNSVVVVKKIQNKTTFIFPNINFLHQIQIVP
ncbi:hypothetical protein KEM48_014233 [Puccinia striiformis f. sp. tritici PST-130]|nr:hypothetical protein KEM48_014233 [Puccinia striiformis f. sp. tritici PST-130]